MTWSEEFDGPAGAPPDPSVWVAEVGGGGWGDAQEQTYTRPPANASLTGRGELAIVARAEADGGVSSARLTTRGRVAFRYGVIAARMKVPAGAGVWPAFWLLGTDIGEVGWPGCGEIDVMEHVGADPYSVHGTVHGPGYAGVGSGIGSRHVTPSLLSDRFRTYAVEWKPDEVSWSVDGHEYFRVTPDDIPGPWLFNRPFFLLINLAIGGAWPGNEAVASTLPAELLVDWIRVVGSEISYSKPSPRGYP
ncbi:family 16 glycosylhydrolase [Microbacterium sp. RU33B]|uniref:glycoside hydrolase family 16 protein n=1 Tax=Microbacterium sp. RU33B TaxID=1907390 RepID=UPI0009778ED7|nr:glycoside hydrolase family 16 protein [Microbacterium sp. RU33B]